MQHARDMRTNARRDRGGLDANRNLRLLILGRRAIDRVGHFHSPENAAERRKLAIKMRTVTDQDEEMSRRAVRYITTRHRNHATYVLQVTGLIWKTTRHSFGELLAPLFTGREVAALNYKSFDDPREYGRVQSSGGGEIQKITRRLWRFLRQDFDHDHALFCIQRHALAQHLVYWSSVEWLSLWPGRFCRTRVCFPERLSTGCGALSNGCHVDAKHNQRES